MKLPTFKSIIVGIVAVSKPRIISEKCLEIFICWISKCNHRTFPVDLILFAGRARIYEISTRNINRRL